MLPSCRHLPRLLALWIALVLVLGSSGAHAEPGDDEGAAANAPVRRVALLVGANDGGSERVRLHYANSDADALAKVLRDIGGVRATDLVQLRDPTPDELAAAFAEIAERLRDAETHGERTQLLFYYSGHSDEKGLLLAGDRVDYPALRKQVQAVPADVRIAILDSCASGAFTRSKGGTKRPPFLAGTPSAVAGHAFLTSSSADEAAQESDRIGGSYFTHFLATGLRGAADFDRDRHVTLTEAYRFAFEETLAHTESSRGGAQHAAYDIQLAGSGDLVMTDLRKPSATLVIAADVVGRISVRDQAGRLAAELVKTSHSGPISLAMEPGSYQILVDAGDTRRRADVDIARGKTVLVVAMQLRKVAIEPATIRGDSPYLEVPFDIGLIPPASLNHRAQRRAHRPDARVRNRVSLSFLWNRAARVDGLSLGLAASIVDEQLQGAQGSLGVALARGEVEGVQFGMTFNRARSLVGAQLGFINHVDLLRKGAQLGLVNVADDAQGVQVGLVTYARRAKAAIGLLTITKEGNVHPEISTSDIAAFNLGLRFPTRHTYTMINIGAHPFGAGASWQFGLGLGGHIELAKGAFLDIDILSHMIAQGMRVRRAVGGLGQLRLLFGYRFFDRLSVFGGPTFSVFAHDDAESPLPRPGYDYVVYDAVHGGVRLRMWPGFAAGLRF